MISGGRFLSLRIPLFPLNHPLPFAAPLGRISRKIAAGTKRGAEKRGLNATSRSRQSGEGVEKIISCDKQDFHLP